MKQYFFALSFCLAALTALQAAPETAEVFRSKFSSPDEFSIGKGKNDVARWEKPMQSGTPLYYEISKNSSLVLSKKLRLTALPDRIILKLRGDGSNNQIAIRLTDADGEVFRFPLGGLAKEDFEFTLDPSKKTKSSWGKKANGKIDLPVTWVGIEVREMSRYWKCQPKGTLVMKEFSILSRSAAQENLKQAIREEFPVVSAVPRGEKIPYVEIRNPAGKPAGRFGVSYDDRYLYFSIHAVDSTPNYPESGHGIYQNDCAELWIDARSDSSFSLNQEDDAQIVVTPKNANGKPEFRVYRNPRNAYLMADGRLTARTTSTGWEAELRIPLDGLPGLRNESGIISFSINLVDNQGAGFVKSLWGGSMPLRYGFLTFGKPDPKVLAKSRKERRNRIASLQAKGTDPMKNSYRGEPKIYEVRPLTEEPKKYERFELAVKLDAEYKNPFSFDDVNLSAEFVSPTGETTRIDGFLYRKYELHLFGKDAETIRNPGEPEWRLRFAPTAEGQWKYRVSLKDRSGREAEAKEGSFTVGKSSNPGFLRVSARDPRYLAFSDGSPFFGLGFASHSWNARNVVLYTKHYLNQLAAFGGNYTSINLECLGNGGFGLQTGAPLGVYSLPNAFRLDYILECAERRGVYLLPCLHQTKLGMLSGWNGNIYNIAKGGICEKPEDFFTMPEMRKLIKNRLRYLIARWGYSTNILGFEIFNEVNYTDGFRKNPESVVDFHRDLASYLKQIDPNRHLVATCFGSSDSAELPAIWNLNEIDFTVTHSYSNDIAGALFNRQRGKARYGKPNIGGENGIPANFCGQAQSADPEGISFHNNLWASLVTKSAGNVLQWWYSHLHDPLDFYAAHYPQFKRFIADVAFDREKFSVLEPVVSRADGKNLLAKRYPCGYSWPEKETPVYTLAADGIWWNDTSGKGALFAADLDSRQKAQELPGILAAKGNGGSALRLACTLPQKTSLRLRLAATGKAGAVLAVSVNGKALPVRRIADRDGLDDPYADELKQEIEIPLSAGENTIELDNRGDSFLSLASVQIDRFGKAGSAENIRAGALSGPQTKLVWIQNMQNSWYKVYCGEKVETVRGLTLELDNVSGLWSVRWYDPYKGEYGREEQIRFTGKGRLPVPEFRRDIALKMKRISE